VNRAFFSAKLKELHNDQAKSERVAVAYKVRHVKDLQDRYDRCLAIQAVRCGKFITPMLARVQRIKDSNSAGTTQAHRHRD
jgi:hypothetical protein